MKKIIISTIILGMAATTAIAKDLTVTHYPNGDYLEEVQLGIEESSIKSYSEITNLILISGEEDGVFGEFDVNLYKLINVFGDDDNVKFRNGLQGGLVSLDMSKAQFKGNGYPSSNPYHPTDEDNLFVIRTDVLKSVILPENLNILGGGAFVSCRNLESVTIPNSVTNIGANAFRNCKNLNLTSLPENLIRIYSGAFSYESSSSDALTKVALTSLPDNIREIQESAFKGCSKLTASIMPSRLEEIGKEAFNETSVAFSEFPEGLISIGETAFRNTNVTFKEFPKSLTTLAPSVFVNCDGITEFTIPELLWQSIPDRTFYPKTMTLSRKFICKSMTPPQAVIGPGTTGYQGTFGNVASFPNVTFYVPLGSEAAYRNQPPYNTMNIQTLKFEEEKKLEDIFDVQCNDYQDYVDMNLDWKEVVDGKEQEVKFDREGLYTLLISPTDTWTIRATYIKEIRFESDDTEAEEDDDQVDMASDSPNAGSDITFMKPRKAPANVLYTAPDPTPTTVQVKVPIFTDSPKVIVEVASSHVATGVDAIGDDSDNFCRVYNFAGVCVAVGENVDLNSLPAGTYIVKSRNNTTKIIK